MASSPRVDLVAHRDEAFAVSRASRSLASAISGSLRRARGCVNRIGTGGASSGEASAAVRRRQTPRRRRPWPVDAGRRERRVGVVLSGRVDVLVPGGARVRTAHGALCATASCARQIDSPQTPPRDRHASRA